MAATEDERPDVAELLPVDAFRELLELLPADTQVVLAAEEDVAPSLRDHWEDVCVAFHDTDAHHLYVPPDRILEQLEPRVHARLSAIQSDQPLEIRAQAADFAARTLKEAEPELEKLVRSGYATLVAWPQKGQGERAAFNLARVRPAWDTAAPEGLIFAEGSLRDGFV